MHFFEFVSILEHSGLFHIFTEHTQLIHIWIGIEVDDGLYLFVNDALEKKKEQNKNGRPVHNLLLAFFFDHNLSFIKLNFKLNQGFIQSNCCYNLCFFWWFISEKPQNHHGLYIHANKSNYILKSDAKKLAKPVLVLLSDATSKSVQQELIVNRIFELKILFRWLAWNLPVHGY